MEEMMFGNPPAGLDDVQRYRAELIRKMTRREFLKLPIKWRQSILEFQVSQFVKDNPEYYNPTLSTF